MTRTQVRREGRLELGHAGALRNPTRPHGLGRGLRLLGAEPGLHDRDRSEDPSGCARARPHGERRRPSLTVSVENEHGSRAVPRFVRADRTGLLVGSGSLLLGPSGHQPHCVAFWTDALSGVRLVAPSLLIFHLK